MEAVLKVLGHFRVVFDLIEVVPVGDVDPLYNRQGGTTLGGVTVESTFLEVQIPVVSWNHFKSLSDLSFCHGLQNFLILPNWKLHIPYHQILEHLLVPFSFLAPGPFDALTCYLGDIVSSYTKRRLPRPIAPSIIE